MSLEDWANLATIVQSALLSAAVGMSLALWRKYRKAIESSLRATIVEKDATIEHLDVTIKEKDATIEHLDVTIKEKDATIEHLDVTTKEKDARIHALREEMVLRDALIKGSTRDNGQLLDVCKLLVRARWRESVQLQAANTENGKETSVDSGLAMIPKQRGIVQGECRSIDALLATMLPVVGRPTKEEVQNGSQYC